MPSIVESGRRERRLTWVMAGMHAHSYGAAVPHYYFDVYNDDITLDDEGAELADEAAARAHAVKAVRSLAADTVAHGHLTRSHRLEVADEERNVIAVVRFDEAVDIRD